MHAPKTLHINIIGVKEKAEIDIIERKQARVYAPRG
jgi:hypothetical protein